MVVGPHNVVAVRLQSCGLVEVSYSVADGASSRLDHLTDVRVVVRAREVCGHRPRHHQEVHVLLLWWTKRSLVKMESAGKTNKKGPHTQTVKQQKQQKRCQHKTRANCSNNADLQSKSTTGKR